MSPPHEAPAAPAPRSVVAVLRAATAGAHHRLDHASRLTRLTAPDLQIPELRDLLQRLLALHEAVERLGLWPTEALGPDPEASRAGLLRADLTALGGPGAARAAGPSPDGRSVARDPAFRAGFWYVVEGSRLGGLVIRRRLITSLGPSAEAYVRFFGGAGPQTTARWRAVCAHLESSLRTPSSVSAACAGAEEAYAWFLRAFDPVLNAATDPPPARLTQPA